MLNISLHESPGSHMYPVHVGLFLRICWTLLFLSVASPCCWWAGGGYVICRAAARVAGQGRRHPGLDQDRAAGHAVGHPAGRGRPAAAPGPSTRGELLPYNAMYLSLPFVEHSNSAGKGCSAVANSQGAWQTELLPSVWRVSKCLFEQSSAGTLACSFHKNM